MGGKDVVRETRLTGAFGNLFRPRIDGGPEVATKGVPRTGVSS